MKEIAFKIIRAKQVPWAIMSCSLAIGFTDTNNKFVGLFEVPDMVLRKGKKGYYYTVPSKPYMKDGEHVKDDKGYDRYLEFFKLYMAKGDDDSYAPTPEAFEARKYIIGLMVDTARTLGIEEGESKPRPAKAAAKPAATSPAKTQPAKAARPAAAQIAVTDDVDEQSAVDEDDDLPF